ncbi:MAG: DUF3014 domain-containing protein [Acidobacteria bacterium]|nr:DUF3014 domain-containing protein [Acidobacteriota bacterium]
MIKKKAVIPAGVIILVAAAVAVYFFLIRPSEHPENPEFTPPGEAYPAGEQPEEEIIEPIEVPLNTSDDLVRTLAGELSSHPALAEWLMTDYLIRRFVTTVDLIANGESPRRPMDFVRIEGDFGVREEAGKLFLDPAGYERYFRIAAAVMSLDAKGCATLYKRLRLPIRQAYRDMGYPDEDFNATLRKAVRALLETPIVRDRIYLEKDVLNYVFSDPELEKLSAPQKHLLRMGPDNIAVIQAKIREIVQYLAL